MSLRALILLGIQLSLMLSTSRIWVALAAIICGAVLGAAPVLAQDTGSISGVVVDAASGESLPGANVSIKGTTTGTATDLNGRYTIKGVEVGTYDLVFSFIGFQQKTITGVEVTAGETAKLDVTLAEQTAELDEVIVEAEVSRASDAGLLKDRAKAAALSDAISAEVMSRAGAGNAADAMEQVTGASVVDGKYVYVRGLGGRYANTQLNGIDLPSADPEQKSVQFDLFPTDLLKNVVTLKTFTPDRPGDFSGGLVDIATKSFPSDFSLKLSTSTTINTQTHFNDEFLTYQGGNLDWLGFDDGTRSVPGALQGLEANDFPSRTTSLTGDAAADYSDLSKSFNGVMSPVRRTAPINQSYSLSLGNQSDVAGRPLGYILGLTFDRSSSFYDSGETGRYQLGGSFDQLSEIVLLDDQESTEETTLGGIANFSYKIAPNHEVGVNTLYTHSGAATTRLQVGRWTEVGENDVFRNRSLFFNERDVLSLQARGESLISGLNDLSVEWDGSYSTTSQVEPDRRFFASIARPRAQGDTLYSAFDQGLRPPQRLFRDLTESKYTGSVDVTLPFTAFDRKGEIKVGGAYSTSDRDFSERAFSYNEPNFGSGVVFTGDELSFFDENNVGIVNGDPNDPVFGLTIDDQTSEFSSYDGERTIQAGYAMVELSLLDRFRFIGGARVEATDLTVQATPDSTGGFTTTDILPSVNLVYELRDDMNLRAAASRTLARPTFREVAPYPGFNFIQGEVIIGNPDLGRTLISNLDLRWEWFRRSGEVFAASLYFKDMDDPIEKTFIGSSSNTGNQLTWRNVGQATVYGAEFEARTRLDFLSSRLQNVSVGGNLSVTRSQIDVPCLEFESDGVTCARGELVFRQVNDESTTRDLQGQSPYLLNLNATYSNPESGTTVGTFFNVNGERLSVVSTGSTPDVFEQPRPELNVTFSQDILKNWTVSAKAKNVLNSESQEIYTFRGEELTYQRYKSGRSFSLGLSYSLK